jgi:hypothetical protein
VSVRVRVWNKGAATFPAALLRWDTPNPDIIIATPARELPSIAPGAASDTSLLLTVNDPKREIVKVVAVIGSNRLPLEIPTFPQAEPSQSFRIADGKEYPVFREGVKRTPLVLGKGNADGQVNPGESIAVLLPDADGWRAAELFTNDWCVDLTQRVPDGWADYDHVGASAKYSLPVIKTGCPAGHVVRFLARVQLPHPPDHRLQYAVVEFAVNGSRSSTRK